MRNCPGLFALYAVVIGLAPPALAQTGCPPGQTFLPTLNRCIASGSSNCPPGTHYDADLRRCLGIPQNKCAASETFDPRQQKCIETPAPDATPPK